MLTIIIGAGLGFLIGVACLVGQERADGHGRREIARERRALHETRRHLDELADDLTEEGLRLQEWEARLCIATERAMRRDSDGTRS